MTKEELKERRDELKLIVEAELSHLHYSNVERIHALINQAISLGQLVAREDAMKIAKAGNKEIAELRFRLWKEQDMVKKLQTEISSQRNEISLSTTTSGQKA